MEVGMPKTLGELRQSSFHQGLGRKMCAAFVAQQQGVTLNTAMKKVPEPVGDLWLVIAEFAKRMTGQAIDQLYWTWTFGNPLMSSCSGVTARQMQSTTTTRLFTVAGVSNWLAVSQSWVRDHATGRRRPAMPCISWGNHSDSIKCE
jgi:hypothetical protein